jgi:hypothetical protein
MVARSAGLAPRRSSTMALPGSSPLHPIARLLHQRTAHPQRRGHAPQAHSCVKHGDDGFIPLPPRGLNVAFSQLQPCDRVQSTTHVLRISLRGHWTCHARILPSANMRGATFTRQACPAEAQPQNPGPAAVPPGTVLESEVVIRDGRGTASTLAQGICCPARRGVQRLILGISARRFRWRPDTGAAVKHGLGEPQACR